MTWWDYPRTPVAAENAYGIFTLSPSLDDQPATNNDSYDALSPAAKVTYDRTLASCDSGAAESANPAEQAWTLVAELDSSISELVAGGPVAEAYGSCMRSAGYSVEAPSQIYDKVLEPIAGELGVWSLDPASEEYATRAVEASARERVVAAADVACRMSIAGQLVPILESAVGDWERSRALEIAEARAVWKTTG